MSSSDQTSFLDRDLPTRDPDDVIEAAAFDPDHQPIIRRLCLTSGGGDSTVLAHRCRDHYDELVHIDTGTALPGVRAFVEAFAAFIGKPLRVVEAGAAYRRLVLGDESFWPIYEANRLGGESPDEYRRRVSQIPDRSTRKALGLNLAPLGFPGPAGHRYAYQRLKERQLERVLRDVKDEFGPVGRKKKRVMLLSGVRMDESERRRMTGAAQGYYERRDNQVWVNPLLDWKSDEMREYRERFRLPVSDVTALTHRSGECNCLAFAAPGERDFILSLYPEWYESMILPIEQEADRRRIERSRWGWADSQSIGANDLAGGPMCRSCDTRASQQLSFDSEVSDGTADLKAVAA